MTSYLFIFVLLFQIGSQDDVDKAEEYRQMFFKSNDSNDAAKSFYEKTKEIDESTSEPIVVAYKAMGNFFRAKVVFSPITKMSAFKKGKQLLEMAIEKEPENVEIRFLRLSIQENLPKILGYRGEKEEDRKFVEAHVSELANKDLQERIRDYLINQ